LLCICICSYLQQTKSYGRCAILGQRAVPAKAQPGLCLRGHGPAWHEINTGRVVLARTAWDEAWACPCHHYAGRVGPARSPDWISYMYFLINFMFLIKNLFNIIKFKLNIYNFTLNNLIKIFYIIVFILPGRANRA
jgi:hypothetical protein